MVVFVIGFPGGVPWTARSRIFSAVRASPFASNAMERIDSSSTLNCSRATARRRRATTSSSESAFSTKTRVLESSAEITSNDGFSVVAPMSVMFPRSTWGRNASCCALLNRWISSTNTIVRLPNRRAFSAAAMMSLISLIPVRTALNGTNVDFVIFAMICARVVLPTPGGPQRIIDGTWSRSIAVRSGLPGSSRWP